MNPTPKTLILDLLSTLPRDGEGSMPVRALVAAGEIFGLGQNSLRVALARLLARGAVQRDERGRYRLGPGAAAVNREVRGWRHIEARIVDWRGGWIGVHGAMGRRGGTRPRSQPALRFLGFRELAPDLYVRPDNLDGAVVGVRERLHGLGLPDAALVVGLCDLDAEREAHARRLWNEEAYSPRYRSMRAELERSQSCLEASDIAEAMLETFMLGGRAIRQLVLDPLLPEAIDSGDERRALVARMIDYDVFGRSIWSAFMRSHGLPHRRTPADLRLADGTDRIARVAAASGT